ncbi:MAG: zf-HC2 domain-containing protein, partial [Candidatus Eremiobacteraeota bacterium]|nr:zf-HC2 domain-containing protein [Candidatus Eremiobacteraeota bacterium]
MRCSSCESLLDAFVDAALEPGRAAAVAAHLESCRSCETLHRRLRVVDGLLMT